MGLIVAALSSHGELVLGGLGAGRTYLTWKGYNAPHIAYHTFFITRGAVCIYTTPQYFTTPGDKIENSKHHFRWCVVLLSSAARVAAGCRRRSRFFLLIMSVCLRWRCGCTVDVALILFLSFFSIFFFKRWGLLWCGANVFVVLLFLEVGLAEFRRFCERRGYNLIPV